MQTDLLGVAEALEKLLAYFEPAPWESISISEALARVLAEDVFASHHLPPFHNSSMDGYAVRSDDLITASKTSPVKLDVVGDISASVVGVDTLGRMTAMRIMTGAPLPPGADAVVPVEETSTPEALAHQMLMDDVLIYSPVRSGDFVRHAGQDVRKGEKVFTHGRRLRPQDVGMLAAIGIAEPLVHKRPRVALLSSGDELVEVGEELRPGFIRDSNGYSLSAAVEWLNAIPIRLGITPDDSGEVEAMLHKAVDLNVDLILSSAGVSMGAYDFVRSVVEMRGRLEFWRINLRPGKPLIFGTFEGVPILGLPGNPVSALVTFEIFGRPVIEKISGVKEFQRNKVHAVLDQDVHSDGRESYLRGRVEWVDDSYRAVIVGSQDSGALSSLVDATALIIIPAGVEFLSAGSIVEVWHLDGGGKNYLSSGCGE